MSTQKLFWLVLGSQSKAGKIFKDPLIFQRVIDDLDQFSGQSDFGLSSSPAFFNSLVEPLQIRAISLRHQPTLHQGRARQLIALFGDVATAFAFVGVCCFGYQPQIGRQLIFVREVADLAYHRQQYGRAERTDALP